MEFEHFLAWRTNTKRKPYEDRFLSPMGDLPNRLDQAEDPREVERLERLLAARTARGQLFAVMDGVGGAPMGMAAAQATADELRRLYSQPEFEPRERFPGPHEVLGLLQSANEKVHAWGFMAEGEHAEASGASRRPKGAACVSAVYAAPSNSLTLFQAGDTATFVFRAREQRVEVFTGSDDVGGKGLRRYIGLGPSLAIETFTVSGLTTGDSLVLVTDGVYPKGFRAAHDVKALLVEADGNPEFAAEQLVSRSANRGSDDDLTALVLVVTSGAPAV